MNEESTKHLDKGFIYVTYCDGIGCTASTKGALNTSKLGFKVKKLLCGIDGGSLMDMLSKVQRQVKLVQNSKCQTKS